MRDDRPGTAGTATLRRGGRRGRAWIALAIALVAIGLLATKSGSLYYDFTTYHVAGLLLREGEPERAFDQREINRRFQELMPSPHRRIGSFLYSPLYLLPAALTTTVDYRTAVVANEVVTLAALLWLLYLLLGHASGWGLRILICGAFLLSHPVGIQFHYQNWSFLLVLLVALAWRAGADGRLGLAALLWALAIHLKLFAVFFLVPLLLCGRRRLVAWTVVSTIVLAGLALPWVGFGSYLAYAQELKELALSGVTPFFNKVSLQASVARLLTTPEQWAGSPPRIRHPAVTLVLWLGLAAWLPLVYRRRHRPDVALFLCVPFVLLCMPQIWDHSELLLFTLLLCPSLPRRSAVLLTVLLIVTAVYPMASRQVLIGALKDDALLWPARIALLFYPALNLLGAALLASAPAERADPT